MTDLPPPPPGPPTGPPPPQTWSVPASGGYGYGYGYGGPAPGGPPPAPGQVPLGWVATPWGPRWRGPVGRPKSVGLTILLTFLTCGIWQMVWSYQTHEDLHRYRGEGLGGAIGLVLAILASIAVMFTVPSEIEKMYQEEGLQPPFSTLIGLWGLLPLIGNIIWYVQVQQALNDFWVARGAAPA